jgi:uncharacterized protein (UPF0332 family)
MINYKNCIEKGLLRKIPPSRDHAESSIQKAEKWLDESKKSLENGAIDSSVLASYLVFFHAARSILFFDGYREKSHACVARYIEEKYVKNKRLEAQWVELLDHQREIRHSGQYDLSFTTTVEEANNALDSAEKFLSRMSELLDSLQN